MVKISKREMLKFLENYDGDEIDLDALSAGMSESGHLNLEENKFTAPWQTKAFINKIEEIFNKYTVAEFTNKFGVPLTVLNDTMNGNTEQPSLELLDRFSSNNLYEFEDLAKLAGYTMGDVEKYCANKVKGARAAKRTVSDSMASKIENPVREYWKSDEFINKLEELRAGKSLEEFSKVIDIGMIYLDALLKGYANGQPTMETLRKLANCNEKDFRQLAFYAGYEPSDIDKSVESMKAIGFIDEVSGDAIAVSNGYNSRAWQFEKAETESTREFEIPSVNDSEMEYRPSVTGYTPGMVSMDFFDEPITKIGMIEEQVDEKVKAMLEDGCIRDELYGKAFLGAIKYTDYLKARPHVQLRMRSKSLAKVMMGFNTPLTNHLKIQATFLNYWTTLVGGELNPYYTYQGQYAVNEKQIKDYLARGCEFIREIVSELPPSVAKCSTVEEDSLFAILYTFRNAGYNPNQVFYSVVRGFALDKTKTTQGGDVVPLNLKQLDKTCMSPIFTRFIQSDLYDTFVELHKNLGALNLPERTEEDLKAYIQFALEATNNPARMPEYMGIVGDPAYRIKLDFIALERMIKSINTISGNLVVGNYREELNERYWVEGLNERLRRRFSGLVHRDCYSLEDLLKCIKSIQNELRRKMSVIEFKS